MSETQDFNDAQKVYRLAVKNALNLTNKIANILLEMPSSANGDWSLAAEANRIENELLAIAERYGKAI